MQFTVDLPTKPYVDQYIKKHFGNPANFSKDKDILDRFRKCLSKPDKSRDKEYKCRNLSLQRYSEVTKVLISEWDFYHYGWEISVTDTVSFGKRMERRAKYEMRSYISLCSALMMKRDAVLRFQKTFGYTEDVWPYESICRDYSRFGPIEKIDITSEVVLKIETIIMRNLSELRTSSEPLKLCHGNSK